MAHGEDNTLGYHLVMGRSLFNMTLMPCTFEPANGTLSEDDMAEIMGDVEGFSAVDDLDSGTASPATEEEYEEDTD